MGLGCRATGVLGCALMGCVDTQMPALDQRPASVSALSEWDAGGTDKPPVAPADVARNSAARGSASDDDVSTQRSSADAASPPVAAEARSRPDAEVPARAPDASDAQADVRSTGEDQGADAADEAPRAGPTRAGELVITELMIDPKALPDTQGEWFELYNPSQRTLELRDCLVDDGAKSLHPLAQPPQLQSHAYVTISRSAEPGFVPTTTTTLSLTNSADTLALVCAGIEIDRVTYDKAAGFAIKPGVSLALDPEHLDARENDQASAWCLGKGSYGADEGSPGQPNLPCAPEQTDGLDAGAAGADEAR